jgi:protein-disulfide isomerase
MRTLLLAVPAILFAGTAIAQTPAAARTTGVRKAAPAVAKAAAPVKNYKLSGSPTAPITLEIYADYECPQCRILFQTVMPPLEKEFVATGKVQVLHREIRLPMHQYTKVATRYANAAGQIGRYDIVVKQIFEKQQDWAANGNVDAVVAAVLPPGEMQKVRELVKNDAHLDDGPTADEAQGNRDGLNQTPTMVIVKNGKRQKIDGMVPYPLLKSYLDQLLAKN